MRTNLPFLQPLPRFNFLDLHLGTDLAMAQEDAQSARADDEQLAPSDTQASAEIQKKTASRQSDGDGGVPMQCTH